MISPARRAWLAAAAALFASVGDLMLLQVANGGGMTSDLAESARMRLWVGGAMGVLAIPLYAVGYAYASSFVVAASKRGTSLIFFVVCARLHGDASARGGGSESRGVR